MLLVGDGGYMLICKKIFGSAPIMGFRLFLVHSPIVYTTCRDAEILFPTHKTSLFLVIQNV